MKKILSLLLVLTMAVSFVACGKTEVAEDEKTPIENSEIETPEEENEEEPAEENEKGESKKPAEKVEVPAEKRPAEKPAETPAEEPKTVGQKLAAEFKAKASGSALSIAESIANGGSLPFMAGAMEVEEGLLSGFDNFEVEGFKSGAVFMPMIGSIPFIGYIFELADGVSTSEFVSNLKANANLRWNICVTADEMVTSTSGNKVFFVMCPEQFEE